MVGSWSLHPGNITSKVISGLVPTCDSVHSRRLYGAAKLGDQVTSTITLYFTLSHYPDTEPISTCPVLIMLVGGADIAQLAKALGW